MIEKLVARMQTRIPTRTTPRRRYRTARRLSARRKRSKEEDADEDEKEDDGEGWRRKDVWKGLWIKREAAVHDLASPAVLDCRLPGQPPESNANLAGEL